MREFNEKLQTLRKEKGLTQEALADALFVSRTAISKWESGRGYPNIDSLQAIAKFFGVTVDDLLSGEELLAAAQEDTRQNIRRWCDLMFGLLDCAAAVCLFLPFFGQKADGIVQAVSLLSFTPISPWLRVFYLLAVAGMCVWGLMTLTLQNCTASFWVQNKSKVSLLLNTAGAFLFILSSQPYAAALLFTFLIIKVILFKKAL